MVNWYSYDYGYYNAKQFLTVGYSVLEKRNLGNKTPTLAEVKGKLVGRNYPRFYCTKSVWQYIFSVSGKKENSFGFHSWTMVSLLQ